MLATEATLDQSIGRRRESVLTPWLVCFSAALFFFFEFILMNMTDAISPELMRTFGLNGTSYGFLSSTFFIGDVLFLFPAGLIIDRFSTRKVIITSMMLAIFGTFGFALAPNVYWAEVFRFITGIGNSFCFLSCILLATRWFEPRRQAFIIGLVITLAMLGGMVSKTPMVLLTDLVQWRHAVMIEGLLGCFILFAIYWNVQDYPAKEAEKYQKDRQQLQSMGFWQSIKLSLANTQNWLFGLYASFLNLPIMIFGAAFGGIYLSQAHSVSMAQATAITSMIFLGTIFGSPLAGYISDRLKRRKLPMIIGGLASLVLMTYIMLAPHLGIASLYILFFTLGLISSTQVIAYPAVNESNIPAISGTSMALASVLIMGGPAIAQPLFGWLLDLHWSGKIFNHVPVYSVSDYHTALIMLPVAFVIGIVAVIIAKETYCKPVHEG